MDINLPDVLAEVTAQFDGIDELFWCNLHTLRHGVNENLQGNDTMRVFRAGPPAQGLARARRENALLGAALCHTVCPLYLAESGNSHEKHF